VLIFFFLETDEKSGTTVDTAMHRPQMREGGAGSCGRFPVARGNEGLILQYTATTESKNTETQ
jgi:hypothetical protein